MTFGQALKVLENCGRVTREGWNGKGMWLTIIFTEQIELRNHYVGDRTIRPFIVMKTADNQIVPWVASQSDILAWDWIEIKED